ncbi:GNAT family N-acetyltransferase [Isoptericola cucumis]|uniref:UPF0256 protein n=1 Tax=Isoptericola cucumis TaxID=1776856 RepID=A0ABQ2B454_9MICO|nr:GNAT family N-acetyltransferase [Isoptericola cucumis]GGI07511.1 UPF0256 protein [Isoptericola cucumis]
MTSHPAALPAGYRFRQLTADDRRALLDLDTWAFPDPHGVDEFDDLALPVSWERTVGVETAPGGPLAALRASYPFSRFPVPGAELPVAGLTWVGVHPQHRRRGLLTAMIDDHLAHCRERGEPVSALFAAEAAIYGRFGYGKAADDLRLSIPRGAALRDVPGADAHTVRLEHADRERHGELVARLHRAPGQVRERADAPASGVNRPGWATRETEELWASYWSDPKSFRSAGRESLRIAVVERDGEPRGYATFRRTLGWEVTGPRGTVHTGDVVALDAAAARALWGVLVDLDLMSATEPFLVPTDDPVTGLLVDPRAAGARVADNVWVRLVDVPAALAGRRYQADVDVVLGVTDARLPDNAGTWRLRADAFGPAACERTDAAPDLELDVREVGAAYLGGTSLAALAGAGLVVERTPGALAAAAAAFGWPVAPACGWVF